MELTHGMFSDLYENAKKNDLTVQFEGLRIQQEDQVLHIVVQSYPVQKMIRMVSEIHIHIQLIDQKENQRTLIYHDGGNENTEIKELMAYPEWIEAILHYKDQIVSN